MTHSAAKADSFTINELHEMVAQGRMRIPSFQRSFRWEFNDVLALYDSIMKGYPFGSLLLWRRGAPADEITLGAIDIKTGEKEDAFWVVDGQQRTTSLVNVFDEQASTTDPRFRLGYDLKEKRVVSLDAVSPVALVVPLSTLFDFSKSFAWLEKNPQAREYAAELQNAVKFLNDVKVPASIVEQSDESVLREVFDRINSHGKRLSASEIFHAIHGGTGPSAATHGSLQGICEAVEARTRFGLLDEQVVLQALLVRRHPDVTRDFHQEFEPKTASRHSMTGETREEAFERTIETLLRTVTFLRETADVPHYWFVPFRLQFLVLVRFFGLFPDPSARNIELLKRWFWRVCVAARPLRITGSTSEVRNFASLVQPDDEDGSVQRLLERIGEAGTCADAAAEAVKDFRPNRSLSKVLLCAMWDQRPTDPCTGKAMTYEEIADGIGEESSPSPVVIKLRRESDAGYRAISLLDAFQFISCVTSSQEPGVLKSLLLNDELVSLYNGGDFEQFKLEREALMRQLTEAFLSARCGYGLPSNRSIASLQVNG
ncbi:hypothetical protein CJEDD_09030 [Corynebacterium jeddahense]|uniref:GmrSD restriction endonucleases N-terminal domain-containing protein n=2 Tax=Corynebacterium jeddahense TaxID=1414719 RepID=A0ABY7UP82_9CORY|nr:hypothetical protein CJEDD_09030 [Corynebacterium jeddahense]